MLFLLCLAPSVFGQSATATTIAVTSGGAAVASVKEGTEVTLTATVLAGGAPVTPGQVNFCSASPPHCTDIHLLGTVQLGSTGTAVFRFYPGPGSHNYQAVFLGTHVDGASSSSEVALVVTPFYPTTTTIALLGSPSNYTLTATVTGTEGTVPPTGTMSFLDTSNANYVLGTAPLIPSPSTLGLSFANITVPNAGGYLIAMADFNGDGKLDLYSGGPILLGNGDGTFIPGPDIPFNPPPGSPRSYAVGDFNSDGKPDLVVAFNPTGESSGVQVLLGNGDGTFTIGQSILVSGIVSFVATGDFNGDGVPDLALAVEQAPSTGTITILLGNGDGTFTPKSVTPTTGQYPDAIAVGDFNGDGNADLAVVNNAGPNFALSSVSILVGNGDGTFMPGASSATGVESDSIAAGDFNGDGILDLAVGNLGDGTVTILLGNGGGTFTPTGVSPAAGVANSLAIGDFNGDGNADLAVANGYDDGAVSVLLGNGNGTFSTAITVDECKGDFLCGPQAIAVGDFNGDGLSDNATADNGNSGLVNVLLSQSGPQSATATLGGISPAGTGTHLVDASYPGDGGYQPSVSGTIGLTAVPVPTTLTLSANPASSSYGQQIMLTATLSPNAAQNHTAAGTVTFSGGGTLLGTATVSNETATFATSLLPAGVDSVTVAYSGDTNFAASTASASETVIGLASTTALVAVPNPATVGQVVTLTATVTGSGSSAIPTGTITFEDGTTALGQAALDATGHASYTIATLAIGSHSLTASYAGNAGYDSSASAPVVLVVNGLASATALTVAPNPAGTGQTVTLTAVVTSPGSSIPTGSISFYDGAAMLGQGMLDAAGHTSFTISTLTLGPHSLTANYGGSPVYSSSASAAVSESILTPGFTISLGSPSLTARTQYAATTVVTLTSLGSFTDTLALACVSPPAYVTCTFTPSPAALTANGTTTVALTIATEVVPNLAGNRGADSPFPSPVGFALLLSPAGLIAAMRRRDATRRFRMRTMAGLAVFSVALGLGGCGASQIVPIPSAAPGTYAISITATGAASGLSHATQLTLTLTP